VEDDVGDVHAVLLFSTETLPVLGWWGTHSAPIGDSAVSVRGIFFDEDDARAAVARLVVDGYDARAERERLAGEDDDEDHPWAVLTDAPVLILELLVDEFDGWLDADAVGSGGLDKLAQRPAPLDLPTEPKRIKRS
jgi:hypothetical protein